MQPRGVSSSHGALFSHLIGVFCGEVLHWGDDALSNQLTVGGRSLLLDQLRFLPADWSKQAAGKQTNLDALKHKHRHFAFHCHHILDFVVKHSRFTNSPLLYIYKLQIPFKVHHHWQLSAVFAIISVHKNILYMVLLVVILVLLFLIILRSMRCNGCVVRGSAMRLWHAVW